MMFWMCGFPQVLTEKVGEYKISFGPELILGLVDLISDGFTLLAQQDEEHRLFNLNTYYINLLVDIFFFKLKGKPCTDCKRYNALKNNIFTVKCYGVALRVVIFSLFDIAV